MANELILIFRREEMQKLIDLQPDKIIVRSTIEAAELANGEAVGVVRVFADAMKDGEPEPLSTIVGCPKPPCT